MRISPPETANAPLRTASTSKKLTYVIVSLIIIILIGLVYYLVKKPYAPVGITIITPQRHINFTSFALNLTLPTHLRYVYSSMQPGSSCGVPVDTAYIYYSQNDLGNTIQQINFSTINHDEPIVEYISISKFDGSYFQDFSHDFYTMNGYCHSTIPFAALETNASYSFTKMNFSDAPGYLWKFTNFTDAGYFLTQVNHTPDLRPNLTRSLSSVLYKNYNIQVVMWTFANGTNDTLLIKYTNLIVDALKTNYG